MVTYARPVALISMLAITAICSTERPEQRALMRRPVESVRRCSMLRIYVTAALVALVQFNALATIRAAPVPVAFGSLDLTMFAAISLDSRLIRGTRR